MSNSATYTLGTEEDIQEQIRLFDLKPAASLQSVCISLCDGAKSENIETVIIKISKRILAPSYVVVPAMLSRSLLQKIPYDAVQSYPSQDGQFIVLRAAAQHRPMTFAGRVIDNIKRKGRYKCLRPNVPRSYRRRPSLLSAVVEDATGHKIATIANPQFILWKIDKHPAKK